MYLQVGLQAEDRDTCSFLWRDCRSDAPARRYRLLRAGVLTLPCNQDDLVMSCDKEDEVRDLIRRVPRFLSKGGFHLKKWASNQKELLFIFPREEVSINAQRELGKTLGVYWKRDEDILTFKPSSNLFSDFHFCTLYDSFEL
ncbi:hypothetical protein T05_1543 [Trichinella murrelli]|uniref:Uncharacterized protein n=1 Tax=Trichinella murrelli TaxID=144512 RepID=A0A0V0T223_9BILA|nr:hypothetical protein T05_1543 [Trichinella murrelli]